MRSELASQGAQKVNATKSFNNIHNNDLKKYEPYMNVSSNFQLLWVSGIKVTKAEISFIIIEPIISFFFNGVF